MAKISQILFNIWQKHKIFWIHCNLNSLIKGIPLFIFALAIQKYANHYVGSISKTHVDDLILNHLPVFDVNNFVIQGPLVLTLITLILLIIKPQYIIFFSKTFALFIVVRSFFISLTHLGASPGELPLDTEIIGFWFYDFFYNTKGDYFFSGHTGIPFLISLIFWPEKFWRYFFLAVSFIFGVSMLLGHLHYSIDVFAAPFMTYSVFVLANKLFAKDFKLING